MDHPIFVALAEAVLIALAAVAILRAWFQGEIFAAWRGYFEARGGQLGELLGCPLCLSYHLAFWLELLFSLPWKTATASWVLVALAPLVVLAAAALAGLIYLQVEGE